MKKAKHQETAQDRTTARLLSEKLQSLTVDECLSLETIAQLVEKKISGKQQDRMMSHLARCSSCYETFLLSFQIHSEPHPEIKTTEKPFFIRPLALAASVVVLVISLVVVHTSGILKKAPAPVQEITEVRTDTWKDSEDRVRGRKAELAEQGGKKDRLKKSLKKEPATRTGDSKFKKQILQDIQLEKKETPPPASQTMKTAQPAIISPVERETFQATESEGQKRIEEKPMVKQKPDPAAVSGRQDSLKRTEADEQPGFSRVTSRYPNGAIKTLNQYQQKDKKNVLEEIREYDPAGQNTLIRNLFTSSLIKMGYHESGQLKFREEYLQGKPHGSWIKWNDQGRIIEKQIYEKGKLIKIFK